MTVEEMAGEYVEKTEAEYGFDMHPKTASFQGFIDGYSEAMRWRDPKSVLVKYRTANIWRFLPEMPEEKKEVLVAFKFFDIPVQAYWDGKTWKASFEVRDTMKDGYCNDSALCMQEDIYAWMELPVKPAFP